MASGNTAFVIEDAITLNGLRVFKQEADQHYAGTSTATESANGLMSDTDKSKLDGITAITNAELDEILT